MKKILKKASHDHKKIHVQMSLWIKQDLHVDYMEENFTGDFL